MLLQYSRLLLVGPAQTLADLRGKSTWSEQPQRPDLGFREAECTALRLTAAFFRASVDLSVIFIYQSGLLTHNRLNSRMLLSVHSAANPLALATFLTCVHLFQRA